MSQHRRADVTVYAAPATRDIPIGDKLAQWVANDMDSLTELVAKVDSATLATDVIYTAAQRLLQALETAVAAADTYRTNRARSTTENST